MTTQLWIKVCINYNNPRYFHKSYLAHFLCPNHLGVVDNSGVEFHYTNAEALHDAGLLGVGHSVRPSMVIPPNAESYLIESFCNERCTQKVRTGLSIRAHLYLIPHYYNGFIFSF